MRLHNRAGVASSERELYFPELRDPGKADRGVVRGERQRMRAGTTMSRSAVIIKGRSIYESHERATQR